MTHTSGMMQACIDACNRCAQSCYECMRACLDMPDVAERRECIALLIECAQMCQMSAAMMAMGGRFHREHCELCAKVRDACAEECGKFPEEHCRRCAEACRNCAEECRKMAAM